MKFFVAGGTGVIGRPLVAELLAKKHHVVALTRSADDTPALVARGIEPAVADVFDPDAVKAVINRAQPEVVIEQLTALPRSYTPEAMKAAAPLNTRIRLEGGANVLAGAIAAGVRRYVRQSIAFWAVPGSGLANEDTPLALDASPAVSADARLVTELEHRLLGSSNIEGIILRYGFFYGPGTWFNPDGDVARQVREQKMPIIGNGEGIWSWLHIEDAAKATVAAAEQGKPGIYLVANDRPVPVRVWLPAFARWLNAPPPPQISIEEALNARGADAVYYGTKMRGVSNAKAKRELNFQPRPLEWMAHTAVAQASSGVRLALVALAMMLLLPAVLLAQQTGQTQTAHAKTHTDESRAIRPFNVKIPQEALVDLRQRLAATRWPDQETVTDRSQGMQLAKLQEIVRYWQTNYDWRKAEARLNALPQFLTTIDGIDIHFIHVRSRHPNALPLLMTHGWPGSVFELLKTVGPLTDPVAYGGSAADAFDLVLPSIPGYGFSGKPKDTGWNADRIARVWAELMSRLGYQRYVAQGGDWGAPIASAMARQTPAGLLGIHINLPATVPSDIAAVLATGGPAPAALSEKERAAFNALDTFFKKYRAYAVMMGTRPQTIGYALTDSPVGLAAWIVDYNNGEPERLLNRDELLDDITLYWLTNTATSSARLYWEASGRSVVLAAAQKTDEISLPVAITVFPGEVYRAPETWARRAYRNLVYFHEVDRGGHFAAWEQPELFASELRAAFKSLRATANNDSGLNERRF